MNRTTYVLGHRNPDTDSVVSAAAYAHLKRELGLARCVAARAGNLNPQTEYILERFGVEAPLFLPDLLPKVEHYLGEPPLSVHRGTPLWEALSMMGTSGQKALPIVDETGRYRSMLHYSAFAQNILRKINPRKKAVIPTSVGRLASTIKAQPVVLFDEEEIFRAHVLVAALETDSFKRHLDGEAKENAIVIVGDRVEVQRYAIESKVRALVITNGNLLDRELRELAERNRVSVLVSPYDTSSTSLLVIYSTPVETMGDSDIRPALRTDPLRRARELLAESPSRSIPVVDDEGRVVGLFSEGDLIREPNVELILVDHNELGQAIEGAENYRIVEVIDHHRLGSFSTKYPITFINRVVGSTSTIVALMYREHKVPIPKPVASILLGGILSDTLVLRSATTTETDRETAEYLANLADLDVETLGADIMTASSAAALKPAAEVVRMDLKEYELLERKFTVSQVEVASTVELLGRSDELFAELAASRKAGRHLFAALLATDVTELSSLLFLEADKDFHAQLRYPRVLPNVYELKDVLSRKKQLMPALFEAVEKLVEG
ncbi:MAG: putative manganese-dependent inorganic diphosphatase [Spirochaetia bacterium]|nr:putative manganese-dependent inorganic diphosphatase [Spirochaetia bacterium]